MTAPSALDTTAADETIMTVGLTVDGDTHLRLDARDARIGLTVVAEGDTVTITDATGTTVRTIDSHSLIADTAAAVIAAGHLSLGAAIGGYPVDAFI